MSGGELDYFYLKIEDIAEQIASTAESIEERQLSDLLEDLAKVMKRLEYWKSGDCSFLDFTEKFGEFTRKWLRSDSNNLSR